VGSEDFEGEYFDFTIKVTDRESQGKGEERTIRFYFVGKDAQEDTEACEFCEIP